MAERRRLLLVAEAVTLAHLARPLALIGDELREQWDVTLASDPRYERFVTVPSLRFVPLASVEPSVFLSALRHGKPLYDTATLENYVKGDLDVLSQVEPDVVVGDFRLSLSVSARLAGVTYGTIASAYWSPYYRVDRWPVPQIPMTRVMPIPVAAALFRSARSIAFALHARPLNRVRKKFGLPSLGRDLRRVYTDADFVVYTDLPELFPIQQAPASHRFIGPALWEPDLELPPWWDEVGKARPVVYVTLGSSGPSELLPALLKALAAMDVDVIVATAGAALTMHALKNVHATDYLPGVEAAKRARLVVCNGGSLTSYQALAGGVPVLGIASNLDQFLNMKAVENAGAGLTLRADRASPRLFHGAAARLLGEQSFAAAASKLALTITRYPASSLFSDAIARFVGA